MGRNMHMFDDFGPAPRERMETPFDDVLKAVLDERASTDYSLGQTIIADTDTTIGQKVEALNALNGVNDDTPEVVDSAIDALADVDEPKPVIARLLRHNELDDRGAGYMIGWLDPESPITVARSRGRYIQATDLVPNFIGESMLFISNSHLFRRSLLEGVKEQRLGGNDVNFHVIDDDRRTLIHEEGSTIGLRYLAGSLTDPRDSHAGLRNLDRSISTLEDAMGNDFEFTASDPFEGTLRLNPRHLLAAYAILYSDSMRIEGASPITYDGSDPVISAL